MIQATSLTQGDNCFISANKWRIILPVFLGVELDDGAFLLVRAVVAVNDHVAALQHRHAAPAVAHVLVIAALIIEIRFVAFVLSTVLDGF